MSVMLASRRLREVKPMRFVSFMPVREAKGVSVDKESRTARVVIITEGLGNLRDRNYYTDKAVASCVEVFDGRQFFIDHPSEQEESDRPERSIRDLAGYFFDTQQGRVQDPDTGEGLAACFASLRFDESASGTFALDKVATALEYQRRFPNSKDVYAGISINGGGVSHPGQIKGMQVNMVTEIQEAFSADIVTKPARGGRFLALMKEAAKAAAWKPKTARLSRTPHGRAATKETIVMAMVTKKPKVKESKRTQQAKRLLVEANKLIEKFSLKTPNRSARLLKEARVKIKQAMALRPGKSREAEDEAGARLKSLGERLKNLRAAMAAPKDDAGSIAADIKQDLDQLFAQLGIGAKSAEDEAEGEDEGEAEGEDEALDPVTGRDHDDNPGDGGAAEDKAKKGKAKADVMVAEDEDEAEGEDEDEAEGEDEDEAESEDDADAAAAAPTMTDEGEDEDEAESEDEDEAEDEDEGFDDQGMGDDEQDPSLDDDKDQMGDDEMNQDDEEEDEDEAGSAMQYKCAKCGEVNQVMPPKGFKLAKMGESAREKKEAKVLKETIARIEKKLSAKETRFTHSNKKMASLVRENARLRAETRGHRMLREAKKALKEASIPPDILSASDLLVFEKHQWPIEIKRATRALARESRLLNGGAGQRGANGTARVKDEDAPATAFREAYQGTKGSNEDDE